MADQRLIFSEYRFTDPIRYFKANDPYYWEVDNIPLKQLQENCLWLKDQVSGSLALEKVNREDIDELRPYVDGNNNVIKVRPGRYTARINDLQNLDPLQNLIMSDGASIGQLDAFDVVTTNNTLISNAMNKLKAYQASNVLNMNGMAERIFSYPTASTDTQIDFGNQGASYPNTRPGGKNRPGFPVNEVLLWQKSIEQTSFTIRGFIEEGLSLGYGPLNIMESYFVKKWRGVARTAVVDVPEELSIPIPGFDPNGEFFYENDNGTKTVISEATQRIDLLFIYSKSIDSSAANIHKWTEPYQEETTPTKITRAELGILRGAGMGVSFKNTQIPELESTLQRGSDSEGRSLMVGNASDELNVLNGFTRLNVHGSFPAPDDLLNVTPILTEYAQLTDLRLVGQTILPVAYIVVRKNASTNSQNVPILTQDDVIDIRPFFRTTELSYNERAGIAAALPALSLANPAVGKFQLDREVQVAYKSLRSEIQELANRIGTRAETVPRIVGGGYVLGGAYYGVEGVMIDYFRQTYYSNLSWAQLKVVTRDRLGFSQDLFLGDFPDWDLARWAIADTGVEAPGLYPNDYVDVFYNFADFVRFSGFRDGRIGDPLQAVRHRLFGTDNVERTQGTVAILYCKKRININRAAVPWMADYHVDAQYHNCVPLSCRTYGENPTGMAGAVGIWVSKDAQGFTIHCAWVANDLDPVLRENSEKRMMNGFPYSATPKNNRDQHWFAGMAVHNDQMLPNLNNRYIYGMSEFGAAIYPSVAFQVIGYPNNWAGWAGRIAQRTVISLA